MSIVTKPVILDDTGKDIRDALDSASAAILAAITNGYNEDMTLQEVVDARDGFQSLGQNIKHKPYYFDNVESMKAANLKSGDCAITLGYYEPNDGGAGTYEIVTGDLTDDGGSIHEITNGLYAELIIENKVNFKQFGAKGDEITNDYQAVKNCCDYANANNLLINNLDGTYYINGNQIVLTTSVQNSNNVTFVVGDNYKKYNSLFIFEHDEVNNVENVALSTVFSNKNTLTNSYKEKSFLLDTKIAYGERLDGSDNDETIIEPFNCNAQYERLWFGDYDENLIVDVKNISNSNEKGYSFIGGSIKQKNTSGYGISFIKISRNNCIIKNIKINCENANGENAVINVDNGNNCEIDNVYCGSVYNGWGYDISLTNVANIKTSNITEVSEGNAFGNRTVKNWNISDSSIGVWDIHWNAFGFLILDNVNVSGTIQIGYGTGIMNVKNSYALWLETRNDYMQIFNGEIIIDNSYLNDGVHIRSTYSNDNTRDEFFNDFKLPNIVIKNSIKKYSSSLQDLFFNIPSDVANLINNRGRILLDNVDLMRIYYTQKNSATKKIYDSIVRDCIGFTSSIKEVLDSLGLCKGVGSNTLTEQISNITPNTIFNNDFTSIGKKCINNINIRCEGTVNSNIVGTNYVLATLPEELKPNEYVYGIITFNENIIPCYINTQGKIYSKGNISSDTKIVITVNYILN